MELAKKSKEQLYNQHKGTGILFIKTEEDEIVIIEFFYSEIDNRFYLINDNPKGTKLSSILNDIKKDLKR